MAAPSGTVGIIGQRRGAAIRCSACFGLARSIHSVTHYVVESWLRSSQEWNQCPDTDDDLLKWSWRFWCERRRRGHDKIFIRQADMPRSIRRRWYYREGQALSWPKIDHCRYALGHVMFQWFKAICSVNVDTINRGSGVVAPHFDGPWSTISDLNQVNIGKL